MKNFYKFGWKVSGVLMVCLFSGLFAAFDGMAAFSDVKSGDVFFDAISYAEKNSIVAGYSDGTFRPLNQVNRAEFTKIVVGAATGYNSSQDPTGSDIYALSGLNFSDIKAGEWYVPYLRRAVRDNIIGGYPDGSFKPAQSINFAEAAKIIVNSFGLSVQADSEVWFRPFVQKLSDLKAIPSSIKSVGSYISRGEMLEIIYLLKNNIKLSDSKVFMTSSNDLNQVSGGSSSSAGSSGNGGSGSQVASNPPKIGNCQIYPADNAWNRDISNDPVDPMSSAYINSIGASTKLHADFGGNGEYGIPFSVVSAGQALVPINITDYPEESDAGPYPIPSDAKIENGNDAHVLTLDQDNCVLYELYSASRNGAGWNAAQASIFDLKTNVLRPDGWTSADAAGLPIMPGLAKYDEVASGAVTHALRFSVAKTQKAYIHPATHFASSSSDSNLPPMGLRLRLKADYDISKFTGESRVILEGLKKYGMILADNGSNWYITGASDTRWNDEDLNQLKTVPGSAFEAVKSGELIK